MKYGDDPRQGDLLVAFKRPVGRLFTGNAKTAAQRQRECRARRKAAPVGNADAAASK